MIFIPARMPRTTALGCKNCCPTSASALVVMITNLREESAEDLLPAVKLLRRRHLVLLAGIREAVLDRTLDEPVDGFDAALHYAAAAHYLTLRQHTLRRLRQMGVWTVDVPAEQVPVQVVNSYLAIKRSQRL
jgi:uncharacterized protein (DUF58 family)